MTSTPGFSIVLETENLASADISGFADAIASLLRQTTPVSSAQEFVVIDTGELSEDLKHEIQREYPWMSFLPASGALSYYEVKQLGAESVSGEVVIYCDADCVYSDNWLSSLLEPFENSDIEIVAGETTIPVTSVYSMAMALNYMLHRQKPKPHLVPTGFYYLNNVAFRRQVLLENPMPAHLRLYRGSCSVHSRQLTKRGYRIWKQFSARAKHAPPNGFYHYFWRFVVMGHDHHWLDIYFSEIRKQPKSSDRSSCDLKELGQSVEKLTAQKKTSTSKSLPLRVQQKLKYLSNQIKVYTKEEPQLKRYLPFALPLVVLSQSLILAGRLITQRYPHLVLKTYLSRFEPEYGQKLFNDSAKEETSVPSLVQ